MSVKFSSIALDLTLFRILDFEVRFLYCALPWSLLQLARCDDFYQKSGMAVYWTLVQYGGGSSGEAPETSLLEYAKLAANTGEGCCWMIARLLPSKC
jgi:hypothetical protein